jgi:cytochrome c oxidase subunit 1
MKPGLFLDNGQIYNSVITAHALLIIFFIVIPTIIGGFGNWMLPIILGAPDMRFPRLNNLRYWMLPASLIFIVSSILIDRGTGTR